MSCCKKCDTKGNVYPTGQCVGADDIDSDCPIDNCKNNTLVLPRLNSRSIKTDGQEKVEHNKCKYFKLILTIFSKTYYRLFSFISHDHKWFQIFVGAANKFKTTPT